MYSKKWLIGFFMALSFFANILGPLGSVEAAEVTVDSELLVSHERACQPLPEAKPVVFQAITRTNVPVAPAVNQPNTTENSVVSTTTAAAAATLNADIVFNLVNQHRASAGLPSLQKEERLCSVARSRESQLAGELATGQIHAGFRALHLPYWATENMRFGSSEEDVVNWWLRSPIHRSAIFNNHTYSCATCAGRICIQLFTNFIPK